MKTTTTTTKTTQNNKIFHFIGLGGTGSNLVELICKKGLQGKYTIITNPKRKVLDSTINFIKYIPNAKSTSLMSNSKVIKLADYEGKVSIQKKIKDVFKNEEIFVILAGFGGYTGTLLTVELSKMLLENNKPFFIFCSLPFNFEEKRKVFAHEVKEKLQDYTNFSYFDLNSIGEKYGNEPIKVVTEKADEELYRLIENNLLN